MAPPSYKQRVMASLLIAFFILHPSVAIRVDGGPQGAAGKSSHVVAAPAPAPAPRGAPVQLKWFLTPDFPCFPFLPQLLLDICHALFSPPTPSPPAPPAATECRSSLAKKLVPSCTAFLTNDDSGAPSRSSDCCEGIHSFYSDLSTTPFCLCHVANGDIGELLPVPARNQTRAVDVLLACDIGFTAGQIAGICDKDSSTYRDMVPPMDPPSSPPPPPDKKA